MLQEIFRLTIIDFFYLHISLMDVNSRPIFYSLQRFFLKSDEICVGIILELNFKLSSILF